MIPKYKYPEFKSKLVANPKWIARGLTVLAFSPDIATPGDIDNIMVFIDAIKRHDGRFPFGLASLDGKVAVEIVRKHAPAIYNFYVQMHRVPETT